MAHPDEAWRTLVLSLSTQPPATPGHPAIRLDDFVLSYADLREAAGG